MVWLLFASSFSMLAVVQFLPATASLFIALAISLLCALGAAAKLRPGAVKFLARCLWRQKPGLIVIAVTAFLLIQARGLMGTSSSPTGARNEPSAAPWTMFRGSLTRTGHADDRRGPSSGGIQWRGGIGYQFFSSPAVFGANLVAMGAQGDSSRLFCWNADSGELQWTVAPSGYRASFSSPVIENGFLYCGEGFHDTPDCRLMCFALRNGREPELVSQFPTKGHIECTPVISGGRVYFGAGDDGIYCLEPAPGEIRDLRVAWKLSGGFYPDAETALAIHNGVVYAGLGVGGNALSVLNAVTGNDLARLKLPYPVFSPPAIRNNRLYIGMGQANYVNQKEISPGEVRCIDLSSGQTLWKVETPAAVIAAIVAASDGVFFSTVDGQLYVVNERVEVRRSWNAHSRILAAPAVTDQFIYCVSCDGMLTALDRHLDRVWSVRLGAPGNYMSSPIVFRGRVFVGTPDDGFLGVGIPPSDQIDVLWPGDLGGPGRAGAATTSPIASDVAVAWTMVGPTENKKANVSAAPAVVGKEVIVPMGAENWSGLVCVEHTESPAPHRRWVWESPEPIEVSPVVSGKTVACLTGKKGEPGQLVAIDQQAGTVRWQLPVSRVGMSLSADLDSIYFADDSSGLTNYSLFGDKRWSFAVNSVEHPIHVHDKIIALVAKDPDRLLALDAPSGRLLWQVNLAASAVDSPVIMHNQVFVPTFDGMEMRSLRDGALMRSSSGWHSEIETYIDPDRFIAVTREEELIVGNPFTSEVRRMRLGARPGRPPLVGTNAVLFIVDDKIMRIVPDESKPPEHWFATPNGAPITQSLVLADGRVYVSVAGSGLLCLEGRRDE